MATMETCDCTCDGHTTVADLAVRGANAIGAVDWGHVAEVTRDAGLGVAEKMRDTAGDLRDIAVDSAKEMSASATDTVKDLRGATRGRAKDLHGTARGRAKDLRKKARGPLQDAVRAGAHGMQKFDLAGAVPESLSGFVAEKTGRGRRRSRWVTVAWVFGGVAGVVAVVAYARRRFASSKAEEDLWNSRVDEYAKPAGSAHAYPAAGSGTGWPEPQRTPEHMEPATATNGSHVSRVDGPSLVVGASVAAGDAGAGSAAAGGGSEPWPQAVMAQSSVAQQQREMRSASAPGRDEPTASDPVNRLAEDSRWSRAAPSVAPVDRGPVFEAPRPGAPDDMDRTRDLPRTMPPGQAEIPFGGAPAVPSEPPQRPEVPFTQEQAENNGRLQLHQNALLNAFPMMTRQDIVACDGDLDALAGMLAPAAGMTTEAVRERIEAILSTPPEVAEDPTGSTEG